EADGSAPGQTVVGGAHVVDVARVTARAMAGVGVMDHATRTHARLAPAHITPDGGDLCEVGVDAARAVAGRCLACGHGGRRPTDAAVGRAVHDMVTWVGKAAAVFVAGRHEH